MEGLEGGWREVVVTVTYRGGRGEPPWRNCRDISGKQPLGIPNNLLVSRGSGTLWKLLEHIDDFLSQSALDAGIPDQGVAGPHKGGCRCLVPGRHHILELEGDSGGQHVWCKNAELWPDMVHTRRVDLHDR